MAEKYAYLTDQCDVLDKPALEQFRRKRAAWVEALSGDEDHAIWQTLSQMVWREVRVYG